MGMSSTSRDSRDEREGKVLRRVTPTGSRAVPEECGCPGCTGEYADPEQLLAGLLDSFAELADGEIALEAEVAGASIVASLAETEDAPDPAEEDLVPMLVRGFIPAVEASPGNGALALLLAIRSVGSGVHEEVTRAATAAAERLVAAGRPEPRWAGELTEPARIDSCLRLYDTRGVMSALAATFRRRGTDDGDAHAFLLLMDEADCGECSDIFLLGADELPEMLAELRRSGQEDGLEIRTQELDPAGFRWYVEEALDARAAHDAELPVDDEFDDEDFAKLEFEDGDLDADPDEAVRDGGAEDDEGAEEEENGGLPYPVLALLVRTRMAALPAARKPPGARAHSHVPTTARPEALAGDGLRAESGRPRLARPALPKLPRKRKKSDGRAPVYQIRVGLRGATPPIWRRLLVPGDTPLADLHDVIQVAFGWHGHHLYVFETPYGEFGRVNQNLGHQADTRVTLEQVAPQVKEKVQYTYDFGDSWEHEILVEKVLDPDPALTYPRCAGGRRAAPPEDSGGIWAYEELVKILADPHHPEHGERLEWLGLDDAGRFDPAAFDADEVNRVLAKSG